MIGYRNEFRRKVRYGKLVPLRGFTSRSILTMAGILILLLPITTLTSQQSPEDSESETRENVKTVDIQKHAKITLGDGREIEGTVALHAPEELVVEHLSGGIKYKKKIRIEDIVIIDIKQWQSHEIGKSKKGRVFEFIVSRYELTLKDGYRLHKEDDVFPFLKKLQIGNENGSTTLYTFWRDLLHENGTWYTGVSGPEGSRVTPHPDVVKRIEFLN